MRTTISAICNKHGYHQGSECLRCIDECGNQVNEVFYTNKDKLYDFYSSALNMKIDSKIQWNRELKKRGLTDNFDQSFSARKRDIDNSASRQHSNRVHGHEVIKNSVRDALKGMNMYSREKLFIPKDKAPRSMTYK